MHKPHAKSPPAVAPHYYQSSNRVGAGTLFWLPVVGGGGAAVLGSVYAFLAYLCSDAAATSIWRIVVLPFIVLPFFAALLAGLGWCVCQLGKVRRRPLRLPIAFCVGAMGLYAAWNVYLNFGTGLTISGMLTHWMGPAQLWRGMRGLAAERGLWSWINWGVEAVAIFGLIFAFVKSQDSEIPFCEKCGRWTGEALKLELNPWPPDALAQQLARGDVDGLRRLGPRPTAERDFVRVRVLQCPCGASRFVTVERVKVTPGEESGATFRASLPGHGSTLHFDPGSPDSEDVSPVVANLEVDFETQRKLEDLRAELLKTE
jgi:hypothetical protein